MRGASWRSCTVSNNGAICGTDAHPAHLASSSTVSTSAAVRVIEMTMGPSRSAPYTSRVRPINWNKAHVSAVAAVTPGWLEKFGAGSFSRRSSNFSRSSEGRFSKSFSMRKARRISLKAALRRLESSRISSRATCRPKTRIFCRAVFNSSSTRTCGNAEAINSNGSRNDSALRRAWCGYCPNRCFFMSSREASAMSLVNRERIRR